MIMFVIHTLQTDVTKSFKYPVEMGILGQSRPKSLTIKLLKSNLEYLRFIVLQKHPN